MYATIISVCGRALLRRKTPTCVQNLVGPLKLSVLFTQPLYLFALHSSHTRLDPGINQGAPDPTTHRVNRNAHQFMQAPERGRFRLFRSLLPPLQEQPENPLSRLVVVLRTHDPFSSIL